MRKKTKLEYGATRVVFLCKGYAIKVWRPRPIRPFVRWWRIRKDERVRAIRKTYHHSYSVLGSIGYVFDGITCNRREYTLSEYFSDWQLAPVTQMLLGGIVLIQVRGVPVGKIEDAARHPLWDVILAEAYGAPEIALRQFVWYDGQVVLVDYAGPPVEETLIAYYAMCA